MLKIVFYTTKIPTLDLVRTESAFKAKELSIIKKYFNVTNVVIDSAMYGIESSQMIIDEAIKLSKKVIDENVILVTNSSVIFNYKELTFDSTGYCNIFIRYANTLYNLQDCIFTELKPTDDLLQMFLDKKFDYALTARKDAAIKQAEISKKFLVKNQYPFRLRRDIKRGLLWLTRNVVTDICEVTGESVPITEKEKWRFYNDKSGFSSADRPLYFGFTATFISVNCNVKMYEKWTKFFNDKYNNLLDESLNNNYKAQEE